MLNAIHLNKFNFKVCIVDFCPQDVEIKDEGTRHMLILFNCKKDMAGSVDFSAANAKSSAHLRVKGDTYNTHIKFVFKEFVKTVV